MKTIKNILSILSIFLILTTVTVGTVNAATPAETKQNSRLTALESSVNKILTRLTVLESSVNKILSRLTTVEKLENNQSQTYVLGNTGFIYPVVSNGFWQDITNWTFYLPEDSYVYVESSGSFNDPNSNGFWMDMGIDSDPCTSSDIGSWVCLTQNLREYSTSSHQFTGFQMSSEYFLTKGYHTIYLQGYEYSGSQNIDVIQVSFNVITSQNNGLRDTNGAHPKTLKQNIQKITSKNGKISIS